jgi:hypothetical protein
VSFDPAMRMGALFPPASAVLAPLGAALALSGCGSGGGSGGEAANRVSADAPSTDEELADAEALADEAAADEAADMDNFGGNAIEMDLRNAR